MTFNFTYNYPQVARDSGFKLRNYTDGLLDWRLVGTMEIERIIREQSFEQVDALLNHLSEVPLGSILDSNILDSGISKYFMLAQFSIQYLIFCRKFLEETVTDLRESHSVSQMELATVKRSMSEANNEILQLHKKITQMEAIHEIIYPCHLCTKNFVSNDALNLHITRKHNENLAKPDKKSDIAHGLCKERENDLTLINTIKLELEIKHLKERLNNAEKEIKQKNVETDINNAAEVMPADFKTSGRISMHSIGIQSNLSEIKESDTRLDDSNTSSLNKQELYMLQEKLEEFEKWKDEQKRENAQFLTEISKKMHDALEINRNQKQQEFGNETPKSSIEDLETLLTKKIEDIGKSNATNLQYIIKNMEVNYKDKILQLEKELIKLSEQNDLKSKDPVKIKDCYLQASKTQSKDRIAIVEANDETPDYQTQVANSTTQQKDNHPLKEASASESNHTFVKYTNGTYAEKNSGRDDDTVSSYQMSEEDTTDVSVGLVREGNVEKTRALIEVNPKRKPIRKEENTALQKKIVPKIVTKKNAKKLANVRMSSLGVDAKVRTLTPLLKKQLLDELNVKRDKFKQKHTQFYATRNRIKKFVDKLCSTKMPPSAKAVLKVTKHVKAEILKNSNEDEYFSSDNEDVESIKASTPFTEVPKTDSNNFKQRLERILASPIRKPDSHSIKAIVHSENQNKNPIPMPRKRVMFNHTEVQERHFTSSNQAENND